jgi:chromosome segregation ATPase
MMRMMMEPTDPQATLEQQPDSAVLLTTAYEEQSKQLYDARASLAATVWALTSELSSLRRDLDQATADNRGLRDQERALRDHVQRLVERIEALERQVVVIRGMKVVRWTAWPRRIVYRLRSRGR